MDIFDVGFPESMLSLLGMYAHADIYRDCRRRQSLTLLSDTGQRMHWVQSHMRELNFSVSINMWNGFWVGVKNDRERYFLAEKRIFVHTWQSAYVNR